jgi:hypothetical protein
MNRALKQVKADPAKSAKRKQKPVDPKLGDLGVLGVKFCFGLPNYQRNLWIPGRRLTQIQQLQLP